MVAKNKTLIITICSNTKTREGETPTYEDQGAFANHLSPGQSALLFPSRDRVRKLITGRARWETALSCYGAFERWVAWNKYDTRIPLEEVLRTDERPLRGLG